MSEFKIYKKKQKYVKKNGEIVIREYEQKMPIRKKETCEDRITLRNKMAFLSEKNCKDILKYIDTKLLTLEDIDKNDEDEFFND